MAEPVRRTFGPVVLVGLATGALTAVAASQTWFSSDGDAAGLRVSVSVAGTEAAPLALAAALVALASWGVVLVARTPGRRVAAVVGLLAAGAVLAAVVALGPGATDAVADALAERGASATGDLDRHGWYFVAGLAASAQVLALLAVLRLAPTWPVMSSRYDAPSGSGPAAPPEAEGNELTWWKALDEGRDPTQR